MKILWRLEKSSIRDLWNEFPNPKPARTTISTIVRILEKKGIIWHKSCGNKYIYYPKVNINDYSKYLLFSISRNYFNDSLHTMVASYIKWKKLSDTQEEDLFENIKKEYHKYNL
jgi:predicted transcriptional regulator